MRFPGRDRDGKLRGPLIKGHAPAPSYETPRKRWKWKIKGVLN